MSTQHTPGPWRVVKSWEDFMVEGPNGEEIIWQDGNYDTPTIKLEDARLMAAAPDLLEALEKYMAAGAGNSTDFQLQREAFFAALAAIAKATNK
jgi:hypothetical protein